jgi:sugar phosphate isomerase/epimerase
MCNETFENWPLDKIVKLLAEVGYEAIELAPYTLCKYVTELSAADRKQMRRTIEGAGLKCAGLHWLLAHTEGMELRDPDPEVRKRTEKYLLAEVDFCADLGGYEMTFGSPQQRNLRPGWSAEDAWKSAVEIFRHVGERAASTGTVFCIEPLPRKGTDFAASVDEALELVRAVAHPGFQLMVDCRAMAHDPRPPAEQIKLVAPWIHHVHTNDTNNLGPGMGKLDYRPIMRALREIGYSHYVSVETVVDATHDAECIARESLANMKAAAQAS